MKRLGAALFIAGVIFGFVIGRLSNSVSPDDRGDAKSVTIAPPVDAPTAVATESVKQPAAATENRADAQSPLPIAAVAEVKTPPNQKSSTAPPPAAEAPPARVQWTAPTITELTAPTITELPASSRTNQQIAQNIATAFREAGLAQLSIEIEYKDGKATLNGEAASEDKKNLATVLALGISEVRIVNNFLQVRPTPATQIPAAASATHVSATSVPPKTDESATAPMGRTNQEVAEEIAEALTSNKLIGYDMQITYRDGVATLTGKIGSEEQKKLASEALTKIPEVRTIKNMLTVGSSSAPSTLLADKRKSASEKNEKVSVLQLLFEKLFNSADSSNQVLPASGEDDTAQ